MADMIHKGTAHLISHEFSALYKKDWHKARESLRATKSEEEIIYILLRIVRAVYDYCSELEASHSRITEKTATQDFIEHRLPKGFEREHLTKDLKHYIHSCIVVCRKMCGHNPPIWIHWQPKGDEINRDMFDCGGKQGSAVDWTVWPALLDPDGAVLSKGKIIPIT